MALNCYLPQAGQRGLSIIFWACNNLFFILLSSNSLTKPKDDPVVHNCLSAARSHSVFLSSWATANLHTCITEHWHQHCLHLFQVTRQFIQTCLGLITIYSLTHTGLVSLILLHVLSVLLHAKWSLRANLGLATTCSSVDLGLVVLS
jgi:hypothetical protein